jgi:isopentenyl-diphosphate delta-isomerase
MAEGVEWLVLVDDQDNEIGTETRENCHRGRGLRHRAFVVYLFHGKRLLLQRRSMKKLLWPGYWDVSVTSHVYRGETYEEAGLRRIQQELNCRVDRLERVLAFTYWAPYGDYSENEYCVLLVGDFDGKARPNPDEVMDTRYQTLMELKRDLESRGDEYTPWLKLSFEKFLRHEVAKRYL